MAARSAGIAVGIQVDGRSGQVVGKTSRRFNTSVTDRQQTILPSIASRVAAELAIPTYVPAN